VFRVGTRVRFGLATARIRGIGRLSRNWWEFQALRDSRAQVPNRPNEPRGSRNAHLTKAPHLCGAGLLRSILLSGPGQLHGLRAVVGSVFHVQGCGASAGRLRRKLHCDGAFAFSGHSGAAGVGLGKITGVRTGEGDAADGQCCRQVIGQRHRLGGAGGFNGLRGKGKRGG
jgi:hypothetical protein